MSKCKYCNGTGESGEAGNPWPTECYSCGVCHGTGVDYAHLLPPMNCPFCDGETALDKRPLYDKEKNVFYFIHSCQYRSHYQPVFEEWV